MTTSLTMMEVSKSSSYLSSLSLVLVLLLVYDCLPRIASAVSTGLCLPVEHLQGTLWT